MGWWATSLLEGCQPRTDSHIHCFRWNVKTSARTTSGYHRWPMLWAPLNPRRPKKTRAGTDGETGASHRPELGPLRAVKEVTAAKLGGAGGSGEKGEGFLDDFYLAI